MTQGETRHKQTRTNTPTYVLAKEKKKAGSSNADRQGRKEGGIPNPLSAAPEQVCGGGNVVRERRGWNTNISPEVKSV